MDQDDLLLAHFQGRLTGDDLQRFEELLRSDRAFAAEVTAITKAREVLSTPDEGSASADAGWERLSAAIDNERFKPANQNTPHRFSILQVACLLVAAIAVWQVFAAPFLTAERDGVIMASNEDGGLSLQVVFQPDVSVSDINETLYELEATIADGPSALGVYRLRFDSEEQRAAAIELLEDRLDLVSELLDR